MDRRLFMLVVAGGNPVIRLSGSTVADDAAVSTVVGTATAPGTGGTATWSLTVDASGKYAIDGSTGVITVAGALTAGTDSITISVSGLTPPPADKTVSIAVTVSTTYTPSLDFSDSRNSGFLPIAA